MQLVCSLNQQARPLVWKIGALAAFVCTVCTGNALAAPFTQLPSNNSWIWNRFCRPAERVSRSQNARMQTLPQRRKISRVLSRMSEPGSRGEFQGARDASSDSADPGGVGDDSGLKWDPSAPSAYGSWTSYGYSGATQSGGSEGQWYSVLGGDTYSANLLAGDKGKQDPSGSHWPGLADGPGCIDLLDPVPEPSSLVFLLGAIFLAALLLVRSPMLR